MIKIVLFVLAMTWLGSIAALFLKKAAGCNGIVSIIKSPNFYAGGILYFLSALFNIWLLRLLDYSIVLPMTSLAYVWTMVLAHFVLKERIGMKKILGITFIVAGVIILVL